MLRNSALSSAALLLLSACANTPEPPYPAFISTSELPDSFVAGMPGIRAKLLAGNPDTRRSSSVMTLPPDWSFTTGGFPDKSVELYVLAGELRLGEFALGPGSYAYVPAGSSGLSIETSGGARLLYFLDDADDDAVIQTPLITHRDLLAWQATGGAAQFGVDEKPLREDPGSGARTWLLRIAPGADLPWATMSVPVEGFLLQGSYRHAECIAGVEVAGEYSPGGYFHRPAGVVHGGPSAQAIETSVWYLRTLSEGEQTSVAGCP
ncbi:MAG: DUF4437 domain-containing protein [Woeseiaceae bacterium]|nr:DUF4437 domain-containing protein [Woeseiaceae bacterium]